MRTAAILTTFKQDLAGRHRKAQRLHVLSNGMSIREHANGWCELLAQPPAVELGRYRTVEDALAATETF